MHYIKAPGGTHFNYNGDFSGEVNVASDNGDDVDVPFTDLLWFLGHWAKEITASQLEDALEKMDNNQVAVFMASCIREAVVAQALIFPAPKLAPGAAPGGSSSAG